MSNFAVFDIVCLILILIFAVRCAIRGFLSELMSMASVVLGMLAALFFFKKGGVFISERFMPGHEVLAQVIAFILLFLIVFLVVKIMERLLKDIIEGIKLGKADRFIGVLFGLLEGIIVVILVMYIISVQPLFDPDKILNNSIFAEILMPFINGGSKAAADTAIMILPRIYGGVNV